jgi:hypothetical protein
MKQIISILSRRLGTFGGGLVTILELPPHETSVLQAAVPIVVGLVFDTIHSALAQKLGWK